MQRNGSATLGYYSGARIMRDTCKGPCFDNVLEERDGV